MKYKKTLQSTAFLLLSVLLLVGCAANQVTPAVMPVVLATSSSAPVSSLAPTLAPTASAVPTELPMSPQPTNTPVPPNATEVPYSPTPTLPVSVTQTTVVMENGLTWIECEVPNRKYSLMDSDFLALCVPPPDTQAWEEPELAGERVKVEIDHMHYYESRLKIGNDLFEAKVTNVAGCCEYALLKNGEQILDVHPGSATSDPNQGLWNIGGKPVWEFGGWISVIVVDGVDYNEKYGLQGSYKPYEINGKLIYIANKEERLQVVYDEQPVGQPFDKISMPNCCGMIRLVRGNGQYWFVGWREGKAFVVSIR